MVNHPDKSAIAQENSSWMLIVIIGMLFIFGAALTILMISLKKQNRNELEEPLIDPEEDESNSSKNSILPISQSEIF